MPYELVDDLGVRYRLPASLWPAQRHVGGSPRVRFLRGYGSDDWFITQDGLREPATIDIVGLLATDRYEVSIQTLVDNLTTAAASAVALVQVDNDGADVAYLGLLGALPITTSPDGIDGTLLTISLPLIPDGEWVTGAPDLGDFLLLDTGSIMLLDDGSLAIQQ